MKTAFLLVAASLLLTQTSAFAQSSQPANTQASEPTDEVIAFGTRRRDPAMSAYLAGDYEMAEIEFNANAFCALRASRNFRAGIEGAYDSTIRADVGVDANVAPQPTGGQGGASPTPTAPNVAPTARINSSDFKKSEATDARTCEDRGFQLYMAGLSQLKLGKLKEAKESFTRAVVLRKSIHDAYFRLALLEYQDGDVKKAKSNFKQLRRLQKDCRSKCEFKDSIDGQVDYLQNLLG